MSVCLSERERETDRQTDRQTDTEARQRGIGNVENGDCKDGNVETGKIIEI